MGPGLGRPAQQRHARAGARADLAAAGPRTGPVVRRPGPGPPAPGAARRRPDLPTRTGPPTTAGRWALLPELEADPTRRAHASAEGLLERHGVVTRGAVMSERVPGGFAGGLQGAAPRSRSPAAAGAATSSSSLGAAQFGVPGAVDRLRSFSREVGDAPDDDKRARGGARRDRPRQPLRRRAALARAGRPTTPPPGPATVPAARPARSWCSSTATSACTSSAAAGRC